MSADICTCVTARNLTQCKASLSAGRRTCWSPDSGGEAALNTRVIKSDIAVREERFNFIGTVRGYLVPTDGPRRERQQSRATRAYNQYQARLDQAKPRPTCRYKPGDHTFFVDRSRS